MVKSLLVFIFTLFFAGSIFAASTSSITNPQFPVSEVKKPKNISTSNVGPSILEQREKLKKELEQKKEEFKKSIDATKAEIKEKVEAKRAELKERLAKIKDERKKEIVERIAKQLNELNERTLNHFSNVLEKLDAVLLRISSRADKVESRGLDVKTVRAAISEAKNAIAASRAAITAQSAKVYTVTISTEDTLKIDVGKARQMLHDDLAKVRETVKAAREAVRKALVILAQIPKVDEELTPASTE